MRFLAEFIVQMLKRLYHHCLETKGQVLKRYQLVSSRTLYPSIAAIVNSSFTTSTCILEVSPILKEGDFEEPGNNRPISLLPVLSKVCEKVALRVSEHPMPKNKQTTGGGTKQEKSGTPLKLLLSSLWTLYLR